MNQKNEFYNKNILITGASSGIGLSAAFYFLNSNANVILGCQDESSLDKMCKKNGFLNAIILKADLEKAEEVQYFLSFVIKTFPSIDVLINCAGVKLDGDIEKTYLNDFHYTININLSSVFLILKELRPYFSQGASVINLSCLYGTRPMYGVISYAMSKAGLETLTRYAAAEFSNLGIRINAISACPVKTNSLRYVDVDEDEIKYFNKKMKDNIPLGRIAYPDDIVKVIIFLASKRSSRITGQIIKVDGGRSLTSSGYIHYKGFLNMNTQFEPDEVNIRTFFKNDKKDIKLPIANKNELKNFISEVIKESNFTTRSTYANFNVSCNYYRVNTNDELLKSKYLKGSLPNDLLEKKEEQFNNNQKNNNDFPKIDKSIFKEDEKNFEFNNIDNNIVFNIDSAIEFNKDNSLKKEENYKENEELKIQENQNENITEKGKEIENEVENENKVNESENNGMKENY